MAIQTLLLSYYSGERQTALNVEPKPLTILSFFSYNSEKVLSAFVKTFLQPQTKNIQWRMNTV